MDDYSISHQYAINPKYPSLSYDGTHYVVFLGGFAHRYAQLEDAYLFWCEMTLP